jgi:hypothetical protein
MTWMTAVRDHPERPAATQVHVLFALALRMDWSTGQGFASTGQLASDAQCEERTVRRATGWARKAEMLVQSRRGHRLGNGKVIASEWCLAMPVDNHVSTGQGRPVEKISTGQGSNLNRTGDASQPDCSTPPSELSSSETSSSLSASASASGQDERETDFDVDEREPDFELLAAAVPGADERDIENAITNLQMEQFHGRIRSVRGYLRKLIANGDAKALVDDAAAQRRRDDSAIAKYGDPFGAPAPANTVTGYVIDDIPAWCGKCERHTHMRENDDGQPYRCPECHPGIRAVTQ